MSSVTINPMDNYKKIVSNSESISSIKRKLCNNFTDVYDQISKVKKECLLCRELFQPETDYDFECPMCKELDGEQDGE